MSGLKPISNEYLHDIHSFKPGDRLHRLVARLCDTWIDDLSDSRILEIERLVDGYRLTHASGGRFEFEI